MILYNLETAITNIKKVLFNIPDFKPHCSQGLTLEYALTCNDKKVDTITRTLFETSDGVNLCINQYLPIYTAMTQTIGFIIENHWKTLDSMSKTYTFGRILIQADYTKGKALLKFQGYSNSTGERLFAETIEISLGLTIEQAKDIDNLIDSLL